MMLPVSRRALLPMAAAGTALLGLAEAAPTVAAPGTILEAGVHRVTANTTIKGDLFLKPGAMLAVEQGCTLTVVGGLIAPIAHIFTGAGRIDLNRSRIVEAHPEWWGAVAGDGAVDSLPAFLSCLEAHPAMRLLADDYYIGSTLTIERAFCRVNGSGFRGTQRGQGTRLIVTDGQADVLRLGPATKPREVNDFTQNVTVQDLALCRSVPVDTSAGTMPAGLRAQFLLFAQIERVSAFEHAVGFVARGLVRSTLDDCIAFRSIPGRQPQRPYRGFWLDGSADIGLAGGNASLFLTACNATIGGNPDVGDGVGLLFEGAFADSFIIDFETTGIATGIRIDGKTVAIGARARNGHVNLHLRMPIIDQCGQAGIDIRDTSEHALIDITEPYIAVAPSAETALRFTACRGALTITGGQLVGNTNSAAGGRAAGLTVQASQGLQVIGLKILEHARPVMLTECSITSVRVLVVNPVTRPGGAAVTVQGGAGLSITPMVSAQAGTFAAGVRVTGQTRQICINRTGIDGRAVGGDGSRVVAVGSVSGLVVEGA